MYIGDALSMPVHWSYDVSAMKRTYGRVKDYMYAFLYRLATNQEIAT
jgi:hypothetical protein